MFVDEIKDAVREEGRYDYPEGALEAGNRGHEKRCYDDQFRNQCPNRTSHDREQGVVGRDDDHYRRVQGTVAIEAHQRSSPAGC
jgi:hypothetical protein